MFGRLPALTSQTTTVDGLPIHYAEAGRGSPVVLLHGWGGEIKSWGLIPAILAERFRVVALDLPGFGESSRPDRPWATADFARAVAGVVRNLDLSPAVVVGHSHGGRTAIVLATQEPALLRRLVLVDSAGIVPRRGLGYYARVSLFKGARKVLGLPLFARWQTGAVDRLYRAFGSGDYRAAQDPIIRATLVKVVNDDVRPLLPKIQAPTLLVWGSADQETPLDDARLMERAIPDAGLVVFDGAGHFSYLADVERFCRIVTHFAEH